MQWKVEDHMLSADWWRKLKSWIDHSTAADFTAAHMVLNIKEFQSWRRGLFLHPTGRYGRHYNIHVQVIKIICNVVDQRRHQLIILWRWRRQLLRLRSHHGMKWRPVTHICFKSMSQCPCDPPADEYEEWGTSHSCFPTEPPSGAKLTAIRQMMLRIHRASGRPSMASLKKMLQMRGAPKWAQQMAENLQGPDCIESKKPHPAPPSLLEETPALFQQVGTDVFEAEYADVKNDGGSSNLKAKFVLWRDRASGLTVVDLLKKFGDETKHWEPHEFDEEFLQVSGIESISEVDHLWSGFLFHQPGVAGLLLSKWHWSVNITCRSSLGSWSGRGNYRGFESNN